MRTISNVQVLRGLAATSVMMAHAVGMLVAVGIPISLPDVDWGAFGVDVFFVISGFVIAYSSRPLFGRWDAVLPFLWNRVARVVPLYWLASIAFALLTIPHGAPAREVRQDIWDCVGVEVERAALGTVSRMGVALEHRRGHIAEMEQARQHQPAGAAADDRDAGHRCHGRTLRLHRSLYNMDRVLCNGFQ